MQEPILFSDLIAETKDGEWGEGQQAPGHVLSDVIRGTDFADLHAPGIELPQRWILEHLVARKALKADDILIETAGGTAKQSTGRTALITKEFLASRGNRPVLCSSFARHLRVDREKVDPGYLYYVLQALYASGYMGVFNLQHTGVARFQFTAFRTKTWLTLHESAAQPKIAALLKSYADLIANNQRRIALLESMAEEIYREWFVRMRFPGAGQTSSSNGVPAGWASMPLRRLIKHYIGGGWGEEQASTTCPDGAFVIRGTDLPAIQGGDWGDFVYRFHKTSALASRTLAAGDFVFEVSGGSTNQLLGRNVMVSAQLLEHLDAPAICASFCKLIRFDHAAIAPLWMKYFLKLYYDSGLVGLYQVQSTGISNYQFEAFITRQTVLVPDTSLQAEFCKLVEPLNEQRDSLARANVRLKKTRDALLPRLISGKLRVDALDIQFPPSMQQPPAEAAQPAAISS
jgi:type I restriction enzyme, S subunit